MDIQSDLKLTKSIFDILLSKCDSGESCITVAAMVLEAALIASLNADLSEKQVEEVVDNLASQLKLELYKNLQNLNKAMKELMTSHYSKQFKTEKFGEGEWVDEPDEVVFTHCGFKCRVSRIGVNETPFPGIFTAHLCGYIFVPKDHPWFGLSKEDFWEKDIDVHGGISDSYPYSDDLWRIGFDCAHSGDYVPGFNSTKKNEFLSQLDHAIPKDSFLGRMFNPTYKNVAFVTEELKKLAEQAQDAKKTGTSNEV